MADAAQIDAYLKGKGSPMAGLGNVIVAAGRKYGVDPALLVGISGAESSFGKYISGPHNAWGWGPGRPFGSWEEGISTVARGLRSGYYNEGRNTPATIVSKWAPSSAGNDESVWTNNVSTFMRELGASPGAAYAARPSAIPTADVTIPRTPSFELPEFDPRPLIASQRGMSAGQRVRGLVDAMIENQQSRAAMRSMTDIRPSVVPGSWSVPSTSGTGPVSGPRGQVTIRPGADRADMPTNPAVVDFVGTIASLYGPLTIGTGTNHNQFVKGTRRQSQHWTGDAADIPASGEALTRLGQAALIAAGMPEAQARKQTGGVFNVNGRQILFNTNVGGNHFNHLHVGL